MMNTGEYAASYDNKYDNMSKDEKVSIVIDSMRFPLVCLVVLVHMLPFTHMKVNINWSGNDMYVLVSELLSHTLGRIAVPFFFLFSGYYFFKRYYGSIYRFYIKQIKNRWRTLFLPYVIWNLVMVLAILSKNYLFIAFGMGRDDSYLTLQSSSIYKLFWETPINFPLWYIRDLACMVFLSPLFYILFKYTRNIGMLILALLYFAVIESRIPGFSTTAFFFFGLGSYLALSKINLLDLASKSKAISAVMAAFLLFFATIMNHTDYYEYLVRIFILCAFFSMVNLFDVLCGKYNLRARLLGLAPVAFFIYVSHEVYVLNWLKGASARLSIVDNGWGKLLVYFLVPALCILICIAIYRFLKRLTPSFLLMCVGGRLTSIRQSKEGRDN